MPYVIIGGLVIASTVLAGTAWIVLRRRQPYLTEDALLSDASNSTNHLLLLRRFKEADRAALKQVFAKSPNFVWIHNNGNPLSINDEAPLAEQVSYMVEFVFQMAESYGHIIESVDKDGNYQGSICLIPPVSPSLSTMPLLLKQLSQEWERHRRSSGTIQNAKLVLSPSSRRQNITTTL
jgi:hypothetical protein